MPIKLDKCQRWNSVKLYLKEHFGIVVNFSDRSSNYYTAWQYITKEDQAFIESDGHPDLSNTPQPRTMAASKARRGNQTEPNTDDFFFDCSQIGNETQANQNKEKSGHKRLSAFDASEIVVEKKIKTSTELLALANNQKLEGKTVLAEFVVNRGIKVVDETINSAWDLFYADEKLQRSKLSLMDLLKKFSDEPRAKKCNGDWLRYAAEVLNNNSVSVESFAKSVRDLLEKGRGKYRNLMIVELANCGKAFLLNPMSEIYTCLQNPATTSFAWEGAGKSVVIFLNDFCWSPQVLVWHDLLLLLERQTVHLPVQKHTIPKILCLTRTLPYFAPVSISLYYICKRGTS